MQNQALKDMTIGEIAATIPQSIALFRKRKIDFCCGGNVKAQLYLDQDPSLLDALESLRSESFGNSEWLDADIPTLVDHIIKNYHEPHRAALSEIQKLAHRVEFRHRKNPMVPKGLSEFLEGFNEELRNHMAKEEAVLFPLLQSDPSARPLMPVQVLTQEHQDHKESILKLQSLCHQFQLPDEACPSWKALYFSVQNLINDLQQHIHLENNILFKRILER